jgi:glycosyltransferase involved in cell wall biosynthesis
LNNVQTIAMKPLRITLILPFPVAKPVGGVRILYECANRLHAKGHEVIVLHSIKRPYKKMKSPLWLKQISYKVKGIARPKWFLLDKDISSLIVPEISGQYVPDADIVMSTWWQMAYAINNLPAQKGKAFNLIQDYEIWDGSSELVHASYRLPVNHIVIAKFLEEIVFKHSGKKPFRFTISIDTEKFYIRRPIEKRKPDSIIMLYSKEPRKGTVYGLEALMKLKKNVPSLTATLFGVYNKPALPGWITYYKKPGNLPELYNEHAIFFTPSLGEGWALPPAEAMACGCALVCTDIGGHAGYAIDKETCLLVQPEQVDDMIEKLNQLVTDNEQRIELAKRGNKYLAANFDFDLSIAQLEKYFYEALKKQ